MSLPEAALRAGPASSRSIVTILTVRRAESEARARFATVPVVRLGTADRQGRPHLVVVTFAVDGDTIYTAVDQKPKSSTAGLRFATRASRTDSPP